MTPRFLLVASCLLIVNIVACQKSTWHYSVDGHFRSNIKLRYEDRGIPVPMVVDDASGQLLRIIPKGSTIHCDEKELEDGIQLKNAHYNVLQVFDNHLNLDDKKAIAPHNGQINNMGIVDYHHCDSSSTSSSSSCTFSSGSSSNNASARFMVAHTNDTETQNSGVLYDFDGCHLRKHCHFVDSNNMVKAMVGHNEEVGVLYPDHLDFLSKDCQLLRSIPSFVFGNDTHYDAVDFIFDHSQNLAYVGFLGNFFALYDTATLDLLAAGFLFGDEADPSPFHLYPSAMTWIFQNGIRRFTLRMYVREGEFQGVYIISFDRFVDGKGIAGHAVIKDPLFMGKHDTAAILCRSAEQFPAIVNDYRNMVDISVQKADENDHVLHMYATRFYNSDLSSDDDGIQRDCADIPLPECMVSQRVMAWANGKVGDLNALYLTMVPSLDILKITYEWIFFSGDSLPA